MLQKSPTIMPGLGWVTSICTAHPPFQLVWRDLKLEEVLRTSIYFCHPYHSWEKGLVENSNRWLREFVPKKTDVQSISREFLIDIEMYFNHKPRECLDGYTAYEVMMKEECGMLVESLTVNFPVRIEG